MSTDQEFLSADKPIDDPDHDALGYRIFAVHLAKSIQKMATPRGLVIAIHGPWGSGKSTMLNFIIRYLTANEEAKPIIMRFNPWWFSGQEMLTLHFFAQLSNTLASKMENAKDELKNKIGSFGKLVSKLPTPVAGIGEYLEDWSKPENDVITRKQEVEAILADQNTRIVVVIDDIDRLTADEIKQLFKLIKAVADFPNMIYVLAFDREVVVNALEDIQRISGDTYLEKIVQAPFELPIPDSLALENMFFERLDVILSQTPEYLWDSRRWSNIYRHTVQPYLSTPRDVVRLSNILSVTYPAVEREVNPPDFIALETIRMFDPDMYSRIRDNKEMFVGRLSDYYTGQSLDSFREFHQGWLSSIKESSRENLVNMLVSIFPKLDNLRRRGSIAHGADSEIRWRRELRICSPDVFDTYFKLSIPPERISNFEMLQIMDLSSSSEAFGYKLKELAAQQIPIGLSRLRVFLETASSYIDVLDEAKIQNIVIAFYQYGDELLSEHDTTYRMPFDDNITKIWLLTWHLLKSLEEERRVHIFETVIEHSTSISILTDQMILLRQEHGKSATEPEPEDYRLVSSENLEKIGLMALEKLRTFAENNKISDTNNIQGTLGLWADLSTYSEVKEWANNLTTNNKGVFHLLEMFLGFTVSSSGKHPRLDPKWLEDYVDIDQIFERLNAITEETQLTDKQSMAIRQFQIEYEIRKQGNDPATVLRRNRILGN